MILLRLKQAVVHRFMRTSTSLWIKKAIDASVVSPLSPVAGILVGKIVTTGLAYFQAMDTKKQMPEAELMIDRLVDQQLMLQWE